MENDDNASHTEQKNCVVTNEKSVVKEWKDKAGGRKVLIYGIYIKFVQNVVVYLS